MSRKGNTAKKKKEKKKFSGWREIISEGNTDLQNEWKHLKWQLMFYSNDYKSMVIYKRFLSHNFFKVYMILNKNWGVKNVFQELELKDP